MSSIVGVVCLRVHNHMFVEKKEAWSEKNSSAFNAFTVNRSTLSWLEIHAVPQLNNELIQPMLNDYDKYWLINYCWAINVCVPGLASNKNLAGVHDTAGQAGSVDGAQGRTELDDVGPDQRLGEQTCVLPWRGRFMLSCIHTQTHVLSHTHTHRQARQCNWIDFFSSGKTSRLLWVSNDTYVTSSINMMIIINESKVPIKSESSYEKYPSYFPLFCLTTILNQRKFIVSCKTEIFKTEKQLVTRQKRKVLGCVLHTKDQCFKLRKPEMATKKKVCLP